jgi:hypothetical protein
MRAYRLQSTEDTAQNVQVSTQERQSRFAILLLCSRCDDNDVSLSSFRVRASTDFGATTSRILHAVDLASEEGRLWVDE